MFFRRRSALTRSQISKLLSLVNQEIAACEYLIEVGNLSAEPIRMVREDIERLHATRNTLSTLYDRMR